MKFRWQVLPWFVAVLLGVPLWKGMSQDAVRLDVLIVDGANNHDWEVTTDAMRAILESVGIFRVDVSTAPQSSELRTIRPPRDESLREDYRAYEKVKSAAFAASRKQLEDFLLQWTPQFQNYDVVVVNYNGRNWNEKTRTSFVEYLKDGGGAVFVHAANNAFRDWKEFNDIIGMGWRPAPYGKAIKIDPESGDPFWDKEAGNSGHGSKHSFQVTVRQPDHPIMKGLPGCGCTVRMSCITTCAGLPKT